MNKKYETHDFLLDTIDFELNLYISSPELNLKTR